MAPNVRRKPLGGESHGVRVPVHRLPQSGIPGPPERLRSRLLAVVDILPTHHVWTHVFHQAWSAYVTDLVRCVALPCGHYPAEQAPEETYAELRAFLGR